MSDAETKKTETVRPFKAAVEATTNAASQAAETTRSALNAAQDKVNGTLHEMQTKLSDGFSKASETAREVYDFQRGTLDTLVEAGKIYGEGLQNLVTHAAAVNREQFEETVSTLRTLMSTRSLGEAVRLQTELARKVTSRSLTEGSKLVHDYLKVTEQAVAPLTARAQDAADRIAKAA
jgi:phasin family protein